MPFSKIRGQPAVVEFLLNAVRSGRVPHAFLFEGPEGVGKSRAALALAQALNCVGQRAESGDGCGVCTACVRIAAGHHPDVETFRPEGQYVKIEQMRALRDRAYIKATEGPWKVFIVDGAHRMNRESANCVLKVLEEPPDRTMLVLVAEDEYSLPNTIPSRCSVVPFSPLSADIVIRVLAERSDRPAEELEAIARISGGNLTEAVRYLDLPWIMEIRTRAMELLFRAAAIEAEVELLSLAAEVVALSDKLCEKMEKAGGGVNRFQALGVIYRIWVSAMRDWLLMSRGINDRVANADQAEQFQRVLEGIDPGAILRWLALALKKASDLAGNANRLLSVESLLYEMSAERLGPIELYAP